MQLKQSEYLLNCKPALQQLLSILKPNYEYVSILACDSNGTSYNISQRNKRVSEFMMHERGFVVRVYRNGGYSEYAFNEMKQPEEMAQTIIDQLALQESLMDDIQVEKYETPVLYEEKIEGEFASELSDSVNTAPEVIIERLQQMSDKGVSYEHIVECMAGLEIVNVSKMFLSDKKDLIQAYGYGVGKYLMIGAKDGKTKMGYQSASGLCALELLDQLQEKSEEMRATIEELFDAPNMIPGEYEIICPPETAGMIAHEAFGHGLEMDMFVKDRAIAKEHMGEQMASTITDMYDGAADWKDTASFFFDDEGTLATRTKILDQGMLVSGMADAMAAARLGIQPTGNGRRESFERKVYTRMTNTYFGNGTDTLEDMIASMKYGFMLCNAESGMEDPKHWGIQCVFQVAREIKDGQFTGKVFSPVFLTGYVPDLLKNITMMTKEIRTCGSGMCGKGNKEWAIVSDGGPYLKTKARLG